MEDVGVIDLTVISRVGQTHGVADLVTENRLALRSGVGIEIAGEDANVPVVANTTRPDL